MRTGPDNYAPGESLENNSESRSGIQKIQDEVSRIQSMINDMEAKTTVHMPLAQGDALLKVIDKEKANLAKKREELTRLILEAEKTGDEKYIVKKPEEKITQEFWVDQEEDSDPFDLDPQSNADKKASVWRDTNPGSKL